MRLQALKARPRRRRLPPDLGERQEVKANVKRRIQLEHLPASRGTPAAFIGIVDAPDEASAVKKAIEEYNITDPEGQKRLIAQRRAT
jgi:hypothetical protein